MESVGRSSDVQETVWLVHRPEVSFVAAKKLPHYPDTSH